jgi:simple sugar transport system ATP-binding protein
MSPSTRSVSVHNLTKRFGMVVACDEVSIELHPGEVHGVLGENGAGKSTLMKMLIGLVLPDSGEIRVGGDVAFIDSPAVAARLGVGMVHQHFSLVDELRVWENVMLGDPSRFDARRARAIVREISARYGLEVDPDARVGDLPVGLRQRVEIIKCLRRDPGIIIFDEPTSVLTPAESRELFAVLRRVVQDEGRTVALVSHKLDEIMHATDRVTIMRQGRVVASMPTSEASPAKLARAMVGREVSLRSEAAALGLVAEAAAAGPRELATVVDRTPMLRLERVSRRSRDGHTVLDGLSIDVHAGEIVGIAGVEGNGQTAIGDVLSSLTRIDGGCVFVDGREVRTGRAGAMLAAGVGVIPEDRHDSGCVLGMSVAENLVLDDPHSIAARGFVSRRRLDERARQLMREFEIQAPSPWVPMWSLSGGNQQRVVLARELSQRPKVLVAAQPTRGLDVGAIEYMGQRLRATADAGVAVLLISGELEEILHLSDRIAVISRGRIVGEMARHEIDVERLGLLMGGAAA